MILYCSALPGIENYLETKANPVLVIDIVYFVVVGKDSMVIAAHKAK